MQNTKKDLTGGLNNWTSLHKHLYPTSATYELRKDTRLS